MSGGSCRTTLERLHTFPAFPTCSCPLWLSPPGRLVDPEVFSSELLLSAKGIDQWVKWRTSSAYRTTVGFHRSPRENWGNAAVIASSNPCRAMFASRGEHTPPTMLQKKCSHSCTK